MKPPFLLFLSVFVSIGTYSQVYHGTTIVVYSNYDTVWIAADSRSIADDGHIIAHDKILKIGKRVYVSAGVSSYPSGNAQISFQKIVDSLSKIYPTNRGLISAYKKILERIIKSQYLPTRNYTSGTPIIQSIAVAGFEDHKLRIDGFHYYYDTGKKEAIFADFSRADYRFQMVLLGQTEALQSKHEQFTDFITMSPDKVTNMFKAIEYQMNYTPKTTGFPATAIRLTREGITKYELRKIGDPIIVVK